MSMREAGEPALTSADREAYASSILMISVRRHFPTFRFAAGGPAHR
jgi:hypothetical protein